MTREPRPVILIQLPAAEARAIFEDFVDGQPRRLREFTAEVRRRGGPVGELDLSLSSLDRLMEWMVEAHPRGPGNIPFQPSADVPDKSAGPRRAWWEPYHPEWAEALGPYVAWLVSGFADYFAASAVAARPGSRWSIGRGRTSADFQNPVLQLAGRGGMVYAVPIITVLQWLGGEPYAAHRKRPRKVLELWLGLDHEHEARIAELARPMADYVVEALDDDHEPFTHRIAFDDAVAHFQERRVLRLLQALGDVAAVEAAIHGDREVLLVRAPTLSARELEAIVAGIWRSRPDRPHADPPSDVP